jgi:hypothetical protein
MSVGYRAHALAARAWGTSVLWVRGAGSGALGQDRPGWRGFEWNLDWVAPCVDPCTDCANLTVGSTG